MAIAALLHRILTKEKWQKWKNCSTNKMSSTKVPIDAKQLPSIFNKDKRSWKVSSISKCRSPTSKANWTAVKAKCPPSLNHFFHLLSVSASSPPKPLSSSPCLSLTHWLSLISFSSSFYFSFLTCLFTSLFSSFTSSFYSFFSFFIYKLHSLLKN